MIRSLFLSLVLSSVTAFAEEHHAAAAHGGHDVPRVVLYQAINVAILFVILFLATRKTIPAFFTARYQDFMKQATEAARIKKELDDRKADLIRRTEQLRKTSAQSVEESKKDAEKMFITEVEKARANAVKIAKDALNVLAIDEQKLSEKLRLEALEMSVASAESQLKEGSEKTRESGQFNSRVEGATI